MTKLVSYAVLLVFAVIVGCDGDESLATASIVPTVSMKFDTNVM